VLVLETDGRTIEYQEVVDFGRSFLLVTLIKAGRFNRGGSDAAKRVVQARRTTG
jgi:hypothetical protein